MRSPVVWLCFAVVILCALSGESDARRSYHLIHGEASPIYRSIVPTSGYRKVTARIMGRRAPVQDDEYNEEDDEVDEEEEDDENETEYSYGYPVADASPYPYTPYDDEEDEEAEENEVEEEEQDAYNDVQGRQAYINNHYVEGPYQPRQNNRVRPQNPSGNRVPVRTNNNNRPAQANRPMNAANRPHSNANRRPSPAAMPARPRPQSGNRAQPNAPPKGTRPPPPRNQPNKNQKLTLRPVATSTQFVATPIADLILRLSISIAKPVNGGGGAMRAPAKAPPARKQHDDDLNVDKHVLNLGLGDEPSKIDSVPVKVTVDNNQLDDVEEDERKAQAPSEVVTEESKK